MMPILLIVCCVYLYRVAAYSITLYGRDVQCFSVYSVKGATCTGKYEVMSEESAVTVEVFDPRGTVVYRKEYDGADEEKSESSGEAFQFDAEMKGDYRMCVMNGRKDESEGDSVPSTVAFSFHVGLAKQDVESGGGTYNSLLAELDTLQQGLDFIKDHESFMNQREDLHKESLDEINTKTLTWTVVESLILICLSIWQISYIHGIFETRKRI